MKYDVSFFFLAGKTQSFRERGPSPELGHVRVCGSRVVSRACCTAGEQTSHLYTFVVLIWLLTQVLINCPPWPKLGSKGTHAFQTAGRGIKATSACTLTDACAREAHGHNCSHLRAAQCHAAGYALCLPLTMLWGNCPVINVSSLLFLAFLGGC